MRKNVKKAARILILCIFMLCLPFSGALALEREQPPEGYVGIYDRAGLEAIAKDPAGSYVLMADIDLAGANWAPLDISGVFDGDGHTIYNMTVRSVNPKTAVTYDGNRKTYDTYLAGLFANASGAEIRDLTLLGALLDVECQEHCFVAPIAAFAEDALIVNCAVSGRAFLRCNGQMAGVAGIVGFGSGRVDGCTANVTLVYTDTNQEVLCEQFLGGIMATGFMDMENCAVGMHGYISARGYVHSGGLAGMHMIHTSDSYRGYVKGCTVDAIISFFENCPSRRAYCAPYIGEQLNKLVVLSDNTTVSFTNDETRDFSKTLLPDMCVAPDYTPVVTASTCTEYGFTTYTCESCGYAYTADYTHPGHVFGEPTTVAPTCTEQGYTEQTCMACGEKKITSITEPAHSPGEWVCERTADYNVTGLERQYCTACGEQLDERETPALIHAQSVELSVTDMILTAKETVPLTASVLPEGAEDGCTWSSNNERAVTVDENGIVTANRHGTAKITCTSADGEARAVCTVKVIYTLKQWIIVILLFGWIWY